MPVLFFVRIFVCRTVTSPIMQSPGMLKGACSVKRLQQFVKAIETRLWKEFSAKDGV
jgi:hypothetical protein